MKVYQETWPGRVFPVTFGSGGASVTAGGQNVMPFYEEDGSTPNRTAVAFEVPDRIPGRYPEALEAFLPPGGYSAALYAKKAQEEFGASLICLNLLSAKPDEGDTDAGHAIGVVQSVLEAVSVPLIVKGSGNARKDGEILPILCRETKGASLLIGSAVPENYGEIASAALEGGHCLIAESPIDINIAKQLNIMLTDSGFPMDRIVMDPTTGAIGYGLEYSCSIMERARLAALAGDVTLAAPFINFVGREVWHVKESYASEPLWGDEKARGCMWEAMTALTFAQYGSDIVVMRHPGAMKLFSDTLEKLIA